MTQQHDQLVPGNDFQDDITSAASAITRYLAEHPNSADTLDGVIAWWLSRQRIKDSTQVVRSALEQLALGGLISKESQSGGQTIYRAKNTTRKE